VRGKRRKREIEMWGERVPQALNQLSKTKKGKKKRRGRGGESHHGFIS